MEWDFRAPVCLFLLQGGPINDPDCFFSELRQIFTKFDNFWHTDRKENKIM